MFQFRYNEEDSRLKNREVFYLYCDDKLYYSQPLLIPVKLEINRNKRSILLNNILITSDIKMCKDIFEFIIAIKEILDIDNYTVDNSVNSGDFYRELYKKEII